MPSKKKSRGRRRRKGGGDGSAQRGGGGDSDARSGRDADVNALAKSLMNIDIRAVTIVERVRNGFKADTLLAAEILAGGVEDKASREGLLQAGLPSVVLTILGLCEGGLVDRDGRMTREQDLEDSPTMWVDILVQLANYEADLQGTEDRHRLDIARKIGPLARCMADENRVLFKSNKLWHSTLFSFVELAHSLVRGCDTAADVLTDYDGVLEMILQSLFFRSNRPDIVEESKKYDSADALEAVAGPAAGFIDAILDIGNFTLKPNSKKMALHQRIGATPIVSLAYDPNCVVSFAAGLLQLLKLGRDSPFPWMNRGLAAVDKLVAAGCVDRQVIYELVSLGLERPLDHTEAMIFIKALCSALLPDFVPNDTSISVAISAGLLEMCLKVLSNFSRGTVEHRMIEEGLMGILTSLSPDFRKTSKAIVDRRSHVFAALKKSMSEDGANCLQLAHFLGTIVSTTSCNGNEEYCDNCRKELAKSEARQCGSCKSAIYCSKDCQRKAWRTHESSCVPVSNLIDKGRKLMHNTAFLVLSHVVLKGWDILDCVVVCDMSLAPTVITVKKFEQYLSEEQDAVAKENLRRNKNHGLFSCIFIGDDFHGEATEKLCIAPKSWSRQQDEVKKCLLIDYIRIDPEAMLDRIRAEVGETSVKINI